MKLDPAKTLVTAGVLALGLSGGVAMAAYGPDITTSVGSAISHISRLNHTACSLAVYASQLGLLRSHHARLATR